MGIDFICREEDFLERNLAVSLYGLYGYALEQESLQCLFINGLRQFQLSFTLNPILSL